MFFRIAICLAVSFLTACSPAKMAKPPGLDIVSVKYKITEMPKAFSGGNIVFGPYRASNIFQGWIIGKSSGWKFFNLKKENINKSQDYSYTFNGKSKWQAQCRASKGQKSLNIISYGSYVDLKCGFKPVDNKLKQWQFGFKSDKSGKASGTMTLGSRKVAIKPVSKVRGSSLTMGFNTGYYFYQNNKIIAAVDTVSKEGPVWFNKSLSKNDRDKIAMVAVAFLVNQVNMSH